MHNAIIFLIFFYVHLLTYKHENLQSDWGNFSSLYPTTQNTVRDVLTI